MNKFNLLTISLLLLVMATSCKKQENNQTDEPQVVSVQVTKVKTGEIEHSIIVNGVTRYINTSDVLSPITGYIHKINIKYGDVVKKGDLLYQLQTKENRILGNSSDDGLVNVYAASAGTVTNLPFNDEGGYVSEGAVLCSLVANKDVTVQANVPFEYIKQIVPGKKCKLIFQDKTEVTGSVEKVLPEVDTNSQTQKVLIKPLTNRMLPENLFLTVSFVNKKHQHALLVPKTAVMTNETQDHFWVMKVVHDTLAIQVPVTKGIENDSIVEIIHSEISPSDIIITTGGYGLEDSTIVKIVR